MMRPCLSCGVLVRGASRCAHCKSAEQRRRDLIRGTAAQRGYGAAWQRVRAVVLERDRGRCGWCGRPATSVDHVVSKASGGTDHPSNLIAACSSCNSSRGGRRASGWQA